MDSSNHTREIKSFKQGDSSYEYDFNVIQYKDHYIWGATAGMLINLYEVIMNKSK